MRGAPAVLAVLALALAFAPAEAPASGVRAGMDEKRPTPHPARGTTDYDAPTSLWREGPGRYLLTKDEAAAFRALTTDEDRAAFIQSYSATRGPDDWTPEH